MGGNFFYQQLKREVLENAGNLPNAQYNSLCRYYKQLAANSANYPFYQYNWHTRTSLTANLLQRTPSQMHAYYVLDAGCGVGTESFYWASQHSNIQVTGVDISEERLSVARSRAAYMPALLNTSLSVKFANDTVFDVLQKKNFDLVWVMEAISHIDPAEAFIEAVYKSLHPSGYLIISDGHLLNPAMAWEIFRLRQKGIAERTQKQIRNGRIISYAQERLFSAPALTRILKNAGFSHVQTQLSIFFPPIFARYPHLFRWAAKFDTISNKIPLWRYLGGIYTIVAKHG